MIMKFICCGNPCQILLYLTFNAIPHMLTIDEKSGKTENLAIWLTSLKLRKLQTPQGKKTTGYSRPQGKTKSTKTTSSGKT